MVFAKRARASRMDSLVMTACLHIVVTGTLIQSASRVYYTIKKMLNAFGASCQYSQSLSVSHTCHKRPPISERSNKRWQRVRVQEL